jgi:hypothetical protein
MSRDLELLNKYGGVGGSFDPLAAFRLLQDIDTYAYREFESIDALDLDELRFQVDTIFEYLYVLKRFRKLRRLFKGELGFNSEGFLLNNHTFQTLDEVECAWKNKAFL